MKDQHKLIKGYRDLSQAEIDAMNQAKELASAVGALVTHLEASEEADQRWVQEAKTTLQTGFMQLIRSVARPTSF